MFHAIDYHYIKVQGNPNERLAGVYYALHFVKVRGSSLMDVRCLRIAARLSTNPPSLPRFSFPTLHQGMLLFLVVLLVGAGYGFVKHVLSDVEKKLFAVVLSLQVIANIATIVLGETSEGSSEHATWQNISLLVDLICCAAILFPVLWSIKVGLCLAEWVVAVFTGDDTRINSTCMSSLLRQHLREAASIDGKAESNLQRMRLFRKYYVIVISYVYSTLVATFSLDSIPF
jgi:hypothetical protein